MTRDTNENYCEGLKRALQHILSGTSQWGQENDGLLDYGEIHDIAANALLAGLREEVEHQRVPDRSEQ